MKETTQFRGIVPIISLGLSTECLLILHLETSCFSIANICIYILRAIIAERNPTSSFCLLGGG